VGIVGAGGGIINKLMLEETYGEARWLKGIATDCIM
jgi:hypothetical protein